LVVKKDRRMRACVAVSIPEPVSEISRKQYSPSERPSSRNVDDR